MCHLKSRDPASFCGLTHGRAISVDDFAEFDINNPNFPLLGGIWFCVSCYQVGYDFASELAELLGSTGVVECQLVVVEAEKAEQGDVKIACVRFPFDG